MRYFLVLLLLVPFFASAQQGSANIGALRSRVTDSTTVVTPSGYGVLYFQTQTGKWKVWNGVEWKDLGSGSGSATWSSITGKPNFDSLYWKTADTTYLTGNTFINGGGFKTEQLWDSTRLYTNYFSLNRDTTGMYGNFNIQQLDDFGNGVRLEYDNRHNFYGLFRFDITDGGTNIANVSLRNDIAGGQGSITIGAGDELILSAGNLSNTSISAGNFGGDINLNTINSGAVNFNTGAVDIFYNTDAVSLYNSITTSATFNQTDIKFNLPLTIQDGNSVDEYTFPQIDGTNGQVLTTNGSGVVSWQTPSSGFADPMTTRGDIIYRNSSNTTARLGRGTAGQVLTSDGTDISWQNPSGGISGSGTTNELTYWTSSSAVGALSTATYPSLTELSYTKGLTSSAQTQLTARELLSNKATNLGTLNSDLYPTTASLFQQRSVTGTDAIVSTDNGKTIVFNSATPFNFTIDALTAGMQMGLINKGTGTVTLVAGSGVTLGGVTSLATNESAAVIYYTSTSVDAIGGGGTALTNPMTTEGDIILAGSGGTPTRLGIGTNGYVLTSNGTTASWQAAPVVKNQSTGTVDNAGGFVSGGFGSNETSYTVQTFGNPWGASSSGFQSISNFSAYANNTVIIAEYVILAMKSDGTAAASGTFTARFRKNNSGTWTADSGGTLTTSDSTVITTAVGDINGGVPGYTWTSGAYSGTYNVGVTVKLSSHTY